MHSPGRGLAVQERGAQATALADALASLRRTRARMASLTAYGTAGGRAGGAWEPNRHLGKLQGSVISAGLPGRERYSWAQDDAWETGGAYLSGESWYPKRLTLGSLRTPEKFKGLWNSHEARRLSGPV